MPAQVNAGPGANEYGNANEDDNDLHLHYHSQVICYNVTPPGAMLE